MSELSLSALEVENLTVKRDGILVLDSITFRIDKGEYVGLLGPNGAGKTTLLLTILGKIKPTEGMLRSASDIRMGYVPQKYLPNSSFAVSVGEIVSMGFQRGSLWRDKKEKEKILQALNAVGLEEKFYFKNFMTLSGGQKQRVIIARALVHNPNFLLFDEPTSGVDYKTKIKIYDLLAELNEKKGITILFVSHEIERVVSACKRVLCLDKHLHEGCHPQFFAQGEKNVIQSKEKVVPVYHKKQERAVHEKHF